MIVIHPGIAVAEIDLDYLDSVRQRMPIETHRVPLEPMCT